MRRTLILPILILGNLCLTPVGAQLTEAVPAEAEPQEPEYLVELIALRYRDGAQSSEELWSAPPPPPEPPEPEDEALLLDDSDEAMAEETLEEPAEEDLPPEELMELPTRADLIPVPPTEFQLLDIARKLASSRTYEPLAHFAWKQHAYPLDIAPAFVLEAELRQNNLAGSITFSKGRYLRLDVDVEYSPYGTGLPASGGRLFDPYGANAPYSPVFSITEHRRGMRSDEIHFFDHPEFALLARITLLEDPEAESEEESEAEESGTEQTAEN